MPPIETYEIVDGHRVDLPIGDASPTGSAAAGAGTDALGATPEVPAGPGEPSPASPAGTPSPSPGEGEGDTDDPDSPEDAPVTAGYIHRRIAKLTARHRAAERALDTERQQGALRQAQLEGQLHQVTQMLAGAAPALPAAAAPPPGPPQAEHFASHEDYVLAAGRYAAQQELQARDDRSAELRQAQAHRQWQHDLMQREATFKEAHPDFDTVVRAGLAGKVSPDLQQALMLVPEGPAVAYALAQQPALVERLNTLPPPLMLVELGRLSPPPAPGTSPAPGPPPTRPALPAPPTPLSGSGAGAPTGQYRDDMSQAEYAQWRKRTSALAAWKER